MCYCFAALGMELEIFINLSNYKTYIGFASAVLEFLEQSTT